MAKWKRNEARHSGKMESAFCAAEAEGGGGLIAPRAELSQSKLRCAKKVAALYGYGCRKSGR